MIEPVPMHVAKETVIAALSATLGVEGVNPWGGDTTMLAAAARAAGLPRNPNVAFLPSADIPAATRHPGWPAAPRQFRPVERLGLRRAQPGHEYGGGSECSPPLDMVELPDATVLQLAGVPVIVAAGDTSVVADLSSGYAWLLQVYDLDVAARLSRARRIRGTAFVLMGDVGDGNYCHWVLDELPRLALVRDRDDVTIVMADIPVPWRSQALDLLGFPPNRVVTLGPGEAVRADLLLIPDARDTCHPARKGAAWVIDWLRSRLGAPALVRSNMRSSAAPAARLYVGRGDSGRRLLNEAALLRVLEPIGFVSVMLRGRPLAEQIAMFARAEAVVALHGAGLTNTVFSPPGSSVLEIFPPSYGTAAFGLMSAACGLRHATYCAEPGRMPPDGSHDCVLDVPSFWRVAEPWLRAGGL